ncbi:conserved hypothetical protein [Vibrio crassostreae]|nr:conserved hypothetical protein [Vibrio crassostreae]
MALPPPPPDKFWKETFSTMSDFTNTSPVPRAVISQPPPAPPGIRKWIFSTSAAKVLKEKVAAMIEAARVGFSALNMVHVPYVGDLFNGEKLMFYIQLLNTRVGYCLADEVKVNGVLTNCL